jgi:manganese/zinc/iron transport system ATP- binding protein
MKNISKIPALDVSHLTVSYHDIIVLSDCTVTVPQGVMLGIIGPNGAGKTTFIKSILELVPKKEGAIFIGGKNLIDARNIIAYIPQRSCVDWDFPLTVFDMVIMGCYGALGWFKRPGKNEKDATYQALADVGLESYADQSIGVLSGGQQQRAFIARALMQDADIYFLDEPFAGVDAPSEKIIVALLKKLSDQGKTIIVVHHDILTAPMYFDWALLLNKKVIACGPIEMVLNAQNLAQVYGNMSGLILVNVHKQYDDNL